MAERPGADGVVAVVFDLDGVLLESEQVWAAAKRELTEQRGGAWTSAAEHEMLGMSSPEWSRYMREELGVRMKQDQISRAVVELMVHRYREQLPLIPGADGAVRRLAARWPLGLASASNREIIDLVMELAGGGARRSRDTQPFLPPGGVVARPGRRGSGVDFHARCGAGPSRQSALAFAPVVEVPIRRNDAAAGASHPGAHRAKVARELTRAAARAVIVLSSFRADELYLDTVRGLNVRFGHHIAVRVSHGGCPHQEWIGGTRFKRFFHHDRALWASGTRGKDVLGHGPAALIERNSVEVEHGNFSDPSEGGVLRDPEGGFAAAGLDGWPSVPRLCCCLCCFRHRERDFRSYFGGEIDELGQRFRPQPFVSGASSFEVLEFYSDGDFVSGTDWNGGDLSPVGHSVW